MVISQIQYLDGTIYDIKDDVSGYIGEDKIDTEITSTTSTNVPTVNAILTYMNNNFGGVSWHNISGGEI